MMGSLIPSLPQLAKVHDSNDRSTRKSDFREAKAGHAKGGEVDDIEQTIMIFSGTGPEISPDARRGLKDVIENTAGKVSEVAVATMQNNMRRFLHSLNVILNTPLEDVGGLTVDTVEISAQIDGKGNIGIAGAGGAELAARCGIKFILRKRD